MRFSLVHKLTSYLMVLAAMASLWFTPELSTWAKLAPLVAVFLSWFAEPPRFPAARLTPAWNIATLLFFAYQAVEVASGGSVIHAGVHFLLFVLVNKMYNRATSKDYRQAYVLSFLILVAATTLNTDISYAVSFALYVLFSVWALTLFHLRREMEENYLLRHSSGEQSEKVEVERILNSRRIVGLPFFGSTSLVALGVLVSAAAIFFLFPRVGFGLFLGHRRGGVAMVGFRERVELGHHGTVRDNPQVVMRVVLPGGGKPPRTLYWRGSVYDAYEAGVWSHGAELAGLSRRLTPVDGLYLVNHAPGLPYPVKPAWVRQNLLRQQIYLEPLDSTVIFAADRPVGLQVPRPAVGTHPFFVPRRTPLGEVRASKMRTSGVRYTAFSQIARPDPARMARARPITDPRWRRYLALPPGLPPRVTELAQRITAGEQTVYGKVAAVLRHLREEYRYTLQLTHDPQYDPVDEFLFVTKRGHCEYFASSMAILLRAVGVHTRQVNGFVGGAWNSYGDYLAVRQGDAHAWVEVLLSNLGWVTFDPTPPAATPDDRYAGWTGALTELLDTLRLRWFRYVVEYDLGKQVSLFQRVSRALSPRSDTSGSWSGALRPALYLAGGALALGLLGLLGRRLWPRLRHKRGQARRGRHPPVTVLYGRLLRAMARRGHPKAPGATPLEYAELLERRGVGGAPEVARFTEIYNRVRFGDEPLGVETSRLLSELIARVSEGPGEEETQR